MNRKEMNKLSQSLEASLTEADWQAVESGYSNFKSHQLRQVSQSKIVVDSSAGGLLFFAAFAVVPLIVAVIILRQTHFNLQQENWSDLLIMIGLFLGLCFFSYIGFKMLFQSKNKQFIFDKTIGWYCFGSVDSKQDTDSLEPEFHCELADIVAVQVLSGIHTSSDGETSPVDQLNLLLKNGKRLNVLAYLDEEAILAEAELLSEFLSVPVLTKRTIVLNEYAEEAVDGSSQKRHFHTPMIEKLFGFLSLFILIVFSAVLFSSDPEHDVFYSVKKISFQVFLLCASVIIFLTLCNHFLLSGFLKKYQQIDTIFAIEELKPLLKINMYSALLLMPLQLVCLAIGIITLSNAFSRNLPIVGAVVIGLSIALVIIEIRYGKVAADIKQIPSDNENLEKRLRKILNCWMTKALPNF